MTASPLDPYTILGVTVEASDEDLDHAFRGLVRGLHPDTRIPDSVDADDADRRLQELLNAYATLRDPIRRAACDQTQAAAPSASSVGAPVPHPRSARGERDRETRGPHRAPRSDALASDAAPIRGDPAIRVGPVHWEPPKPGGNHDCPR
ncbi:J domain-containing protein [Kribbella soli]